MSSLTDVVQRPEPQPSKLMMRVRFPPSALRDVARLDSIDEHRLLLTVFRIDLNPLVTGGVVAVREVRPRLIAGRGTCH